MVVQYPSPPPNKSRISGPPPCRSPTSTIAGFSLDTCIGRGSYSTVHKAHKNRGKYEVVAIKCIKISSLSARSKENLINEVNILKQINHQHIVSMRDLTWDMNHIFLILEYCPGGNLSEFIKQKGRLSEFMVQHFTQQLVLGLQVLHSQNIVHCDLKPANILLSIPPIGSCRNVKLKIADFGFSQRLATNEKYITGLKGSPLYMAPEVLSLQPYSSQADLYSLGVVVYECIFGAAPYINLDLDQLTKQILSPDPIKIPVRSRKALSPHCYSLLQGLLVKDQEKRLNFNDLQNHQFVDVAHAPSVANYYKGVNMVRQATTFDNAHKYEDARAFYIEALQYLVPVYHWLDTFNDTQRKWLSMRIREYFGRAEQISMKHL